MHSSFGAVRLLSLCFAFGSGSIANAREIPEAQPTPDAAQIANWAAPLLWKPTPLPAPGEAGTESASTATAPLPFVAITPCRVADTRGNGFTGQYGPPSLLANANRNFAITGQCGIAASAAAVSFNLTALNVGAAGDLRVFPAGAALPLVSSLNYNANTPNIANAAIVPLGTGGAITVRADATAVDLIIDVNGYYDGNGVITGVTPGTGMTGGGTSGSVSLGIAAGGVTSTELASSAVTSSKIAANAVTAGAIATGQVVKNVNGVTDGVTVAAGAGASVSTVGSTITVGAPGFVPAGSFVLGNHADTTLINAGYTETGFAQDFWKSTTATGAPAARYEHTAVWTGTKMIVWGGLDVAYTNTGGQYDPVADSWTSTTTTGAPANGRVLSTAVWTGSKMIVWGGADQMNLFNTGGQYDPVGNSWTATSTAGAVPTPRVYHTAVWTGSKMIIWGGNVGGSTNTGGQYDPVGNSWTATSLAGPVPSIRDSHTAVWTGSRMIVWGGFDGVHLNTGGQYDPVGNSWTATATTGAPGIRALHTSVWTGSKMVVWGGSNGSAQVNTGGQYDPVGNSWTATSTAAPVPTARIYHTAVWTGTRMIVWGGLDPIGLPGVNSGGRYDPANNTWTATTLSDAPGVREQHTAVWTGTKMIVWGGYNLGPYTNTGGIYTILSLYAKN